MNNILDKFYDTCLYIFNIRIKFITLLQFIFMRASVVHKSEITNTQIELSKQHMKFKQEMESIVKEFKEFLRETPQRGNNESDTKLKTDPNQDQPEQPRIDNKMKKMSRMDELFMPVREIVSRKPPKKRGLSQHSRRQSKTKKKSLAQQMIYWYDISKQQKNMLPQDIKDPIQSCHQEIMSQKLNESMQEMERRRNQTGQSNRQQVNMGRTRHLVLKGFSDVFGGGLEVEIEND